MLGIVAGTLILAFAPAATKVEPTVAPTTAEPSAAASQPTAAVPQPTSSESAPDLFGKLSQWVVATLEQHLWFNLAMEDHLRVFAFTIFLGMQIAIIHASGGMEAIVTWLAPLARGRRSGQLLTYVLGLIIFIDDYANTLLLGSTMRPITDRLRISREKLSFIVDSTAAPVSGIALISTWVATEISAIQTGFENVGQELEGESFTIFLETIPGRFYVIFMLIFVFLIAVFNRDYGNMLTAEKKALLEGVKGSAADQNSMDKTVPPGSLWNAFIPIGITIAVVLGLLIKTGMAGSDPTALGSLEGWKYWATLFGNGNSYIALLYGSLAGLVTIIVMVLLQKSLTVIDLHKHLVTGFLHVLPALTILWLAWTLSRLAGDEFLATGKFLATLISSSVPLALMPTITFVLACGVAFATGTSWGTMSLVIPLTIQTVWAMLVNIEPSARVHDPIMIACIGSVLAGAIFGDHCSPISDTTVLSARASHCDLIAHVNTQMPYALSVGLIAIIFGTLPIGFGVPAWLLLILGTIGMITMLLLFGKKVEAQ